jgi:hypothetical protein
LRFDGREVGGISCYTNHCQTTFPVPLDATPGEHVIEAEGGSSLVLTVVE